MKRDWPAFDKDNNQSFRDENKNILLPPSADCISFIQFTYSTINRHRNLGLSLKLFAYLSAGNLSLHSLLTLLWCGVAPTPLFWPCGTPPIDLDRPPQCIQYMSPAFQCAPRMNHSRGTARIYLNTNNNFCLSPER